MTSQSGVGRTEAVGVTGVSVGSIGSELSPIPIPSTQINPTTITLELILAMMSCFEARLDALDCRPSPSVPPPRPDPDPPYGMPLAWKTSTQHASTFPARTTVNTGQFPPGFQPLYSDSLNTAIPPRYGGFPPIPTQAFTSCLTSAPSSSAYHLQGGNPNARGGPLRGESSAELTSVTYPNQAMGLGSMDRQLISSWEIPAGRPPLELQQQRAGLCCENPALRQHQHDQFRSIKMDPPCFNGTDAPNWIARVQYYFDHLMLPDDHRLHYVVMLFDPPAAD